MSMSKFEWKDKDGQAWTQVRWGEFAWDFYLDKNGEWVWYSPHFWCEYAWGGEDLPKPRAEVINFLTAA